MEAALLKEKSGTVSIVVPIYNEAEHVELSLRSMIHRLDELSLKFEIIVVESGSTDESGRIIKRFCARDGRVRLVQQAAREGMGSAIAAGFKEAVGDYLFWIDGDVPYDLLYLKQGLKLMDGAEVVAGYRISRDEPLKRKLYSKVFNVMANALFSIRLKDINFAFKLFRKEVFYDVEITAKSSFFAAEILSKCRKKGYRIVQLPVEYNPRRVGQTKLGNLKTVFEILKEMTRFILTGRASH